MDVGNVSRDDVYDCLGEYRILPTPQTLRTTLLTMMVKKLGTHDPKHSQAHDKEKKV